MQLNSTSRLTVRHRLTQSHISALPRTKLCNSALTRSSKAMISERNTASPKSVRGRIPGAVAGEAFDSNKDFADEMGLNGSTVLKLRGLPFSSEHEDIADWFNDPALGLAPISADSVCIVTRIQRPSGEVIVQFPTAEDADRAMGKHMQDMGSRYIEIFPVKESDVKKFGYSCAAFSNGMTEDLDVSTFLRLLGVPFTAEAEDIANWFHDPALGIAPISADSVFIMKEKKMRPSGMAFVEFPTIEDAAKAMATQNDQMMGSRYIEIFPASMADLEECREMAQHAASE